MKAFEELKFGFSLSKGNQNRRRNREANVITFIIMALLVLAAFFYIK